MSKERESTNKIQKQGNLENNKLKLDHVNKKE
jgi:hypothetical protein